MGIFLYFLKRPMLLVGIALALAVLISASGCGRKGPLEPPPDYQGEPPPPPADTGTIF